MITQRLRIKSNGNPAETSLVLVTVDGNKETLTPLTEVGDVVIALTARGDGYALLTIHQSQIDLDLDSTVPFEQAEAVRKAEEESRALRSRP